MSLLFSFTKRSEQFTAPANSFTNSWLKNLVKFLISLPLSACFMPLSASIALAPTSTSASRPFSSSTTPGINSLPFLVTATARMTSIMLFVFLPEKASCHEGDEVAISLIEEVALPISSITLPMTRPLRCAADF
jgi:hypothetical protein